MYVLKTQSCAYSVRYDLDSDIQDKTEIYIVYYNEFAVKNVDVSDLEDVSTFCETFKNPSYILLQRKIPLHAFRKLKDKMLTYILPDGQSTKTITYVGTVEVKDDFLYFAEVRDIHLPF